MSTARNVIAFTPTKAHTSIPVLPEPLAPANRPEVYTVAEVAHLLRMSLGPVYGMCRAGQLPARRLGRRWVIPSDRFHRWLDELPIATDEEIDRYFFGGSSR